MTYFGINANNSKFNLDQKSFKWIDALNNKYFIKFIQYLTILFKKSFKSQS